MTKTLFEELIKAVKDGHLYDFIANNYTRLSQYELARIAMELEFSYWSVIRTDENALNHATENIVEGLIDYLGDTDD